MKKKQLLLWVAMAVSLSSWAGTNAGDDKTYQGISCNGEGFYQSVDKPSVSIRRNGDSRVAELRLSDDSNVRRGVNLVTDADKMVLTFSEKVVKNGEFTFSDQVNGNTTSREEVDAVHGSDMNIHYEREFTSTDYNAWNAPFDLTYEDAAAAGLTIYRFTMSINEVKDGVGSELIKFYLQTLKPGEKAFANKPYLVKAANTGVVSLNLANATLERSKSTSIVCSTTQVTYTFTTNPEMVRASKLNGCYVMNNGVFEFVTANPKSLCAWRWFMEPSIKDILYYSKFSFVEVDEDEATSIDDINLSTKQPQAIYNLSGQRVASPVKGQVYIINGKKVMY